MSRFDELYDEILTMEGVISRVKNRKVKQGNSQWFAKLKKVNNLDELFKDALNAERDKFNTRSMEANVEGKHVNIDIRGDVVPDNVIRIIKTAFSNIGTVQTLLGKKIADDHNNSNGQRGPSEWEANKKYHARDVINVIRFETFDVRVSEKGTKFNLYFYDGDLYGGHVIVVHDAIDPKSGAVQKDFSYTIEG